MYPTFKGNGMAFDVEGRLIVCEHVSSSITRFHADGFRETVCFHHGGVYLNSPNDLVASARDGSIYFTDPDYGRWNDWIGCKRVPLLGFKGVFRVPHEGGEAQLVVEPGRVRAAQRSVLLARRVADVRQRLAARRDQGLRRRRRRCARQRSRAR